MKTFTLLTLLSDESVGVTIINEDNKEAIALIKSTSYGIRIYIGWSRGLYVKTRIWFTDLLTKRLTTKRFLFLHVAKVKSSNSM
ncbi:hypothetical protein Plhal304r1_c051g0134361 [Plasmopara halstedii]